MSVTRDTATPCPPLYDVRKERQQRCVCVGVGRTSSISWCAARQSFGCGRGMIHDTSRDGTCSIYAVHALFNSIFVLYARSQTNSLQDSSGVAPGDLLLCTAAISSDHERYCLRCLASISSLRRHVISPQRIGCFVRVCSCCARGDGEHDLRALVGTMPSGGLNLCRHANWL